MSCWTDDTHFCYLVPQKCVLAAHKYLKAYNHKIVFLQPSEKIAMENMASTQGVPEKVQVFQRSLTF